MAFKGGVRRCLTNHTARNNRDRVDKTVPLVAPLRPLRASQHSWETRRQAPSFFASMRKVDLP